MTRYYVCMNVFVCCRIDAPKALHIGYNVCVLYMCGLCQPVDDVHAVNGRTQRRHAVSPLQTICTERTCVLFECAAIYVYMA